MIEPIRWTTSRDDTEWYDTDPVGDGYQGYVSRYGAQVRFLGHPAGAPAHPEDDAWTGLTIVLADSEYLTPPVLGPARGERWDDFLRGQMLWCEEQIRRYYAGGHTAADITHTYWTFPRGTPTSTWKPLPWACPAHQGRGMDAGYPLNRLSNEDAEQCSTCRARYDTMRAHDWTLHS